MERLRIGQYCSIECKTDAKQKEDQLALESLTLFGVRMRVKEPEKAGEPPVADTVLQVRAQYRDCPVRVAGTDSSQMEEFPCVVVMPAEASRRVATRQAGGLRHEVSAVDSQAIGIHRCSPAAILIPISMPRLDVAVVAPPPPPKRPRVDASRIAASFPAMMQAGLVRVEPGFAPAVLEVRPIAAAALRRLDTAALAIAGSIADPPCRPVLGAQLRPAATYPVKALASEGQFALRQMEEGVRMLPANAWIPGLGIRKLAGARPKPDVHVALRYLPMTHFALPPAAADWSQ